MNDYSLGNRICALRTGLCLSQYQLGALVGVSDKAVSKWENGSAKPRMGTCIKLASIFDLSLDELLSYGSVSGKAIEFDKLKKNLLERVNAALHEKYGPTPPIECVGRLQSEMMAIKSEDLIKSMLFLGTLGKQAKAAGCSIYARGMYSSWFSLWLLDGSHVNPLPPHYYCPYCHRTEFVYSFKDGWDLPEKKCCGSSMLRDGHKIPFEGHLSQVEQTGVSIEVNIPSSFSQEAVSAIKAVYGKAAQIIETKFSDAPDEITYQQFILLPENIPSPDLDSDGIWYVNSEKFWNEHYKYIRLIFSDQLECLRKAQKEVSGICVDDLISQDSLRCYCSKQISLLPENKEHIADAPIDFSTVLKIEGFLHGGNCFIENGEKLVRNGEVKFEDLLSLREDVWDMIVSHMHENSAAGLGFALKVMEEARKGYYSGKFNGIPDDTLRLLREINIPEWCITQLSQITYMFPRAHCIELLIEKLQMLRIE